MERIGSITRVRRALPRGRTLPPGTWARRHAGVRLLLALHVPALLAFGLLRGFDPAHVGLEVAGLGLLAVLAGSERLPRRVRATTACVGLLVASAVLVHLWDGVPEAHFHFFVMVAVMALYEEWVPYLTAVAFVVVHHAVISVLDPGAAFVHPTERPGDALGWAAVHGLFILALAAVELVGWRLNEQARDAAAEAADELRTAFDDAPAGMAVVALDGRIVRANRTLGRMTGRTPAALAGRDFAELHGEATGGAEERRLVRPDGTEVWAVWRRSLVRDRDGAPRHWIAHGDDVTAHRRLGDLEHLAHHDPLTGLANRARFTGVVASAVAAGRASAVLYVDLDGFKAVNDVHGHDAGDRLLVVVAQRLRAAVRAGDLVARLGGDEFAVLLCDRDGAPGALAAAQRIEAGLRAPVVLGEADVAVTASVGVRLVEPGHDPSELLRAADAAMYRAKRRGRARVEVFDVAPAA